MNKTEQFNIYGEFGEEDATEKTQPNAKCTVEKRLQTRMKHNGTEQKS